MSAAKAGERKLNVKLLRKIQKHILQEPRRFFMDWYIIRWDGSELNPEWKDAPKSAPPCGTTACIAGWANILSGADAIGSNHAACFLGLEPSPISGDYTYVFVDSYWPEPFRARYAKAKTPKTRAKIAAARIDYLIKEGK